MTNKEESSFLQELDSRLDSLFGEDTKPIKEKEPVAPQAETEAATVSIQMEDTLEMEDNRDIPIVEETNREADVSAGELPAKDSYTAVEIEKRFSEIFDGDEKAVRSVQETEKPERITIVDRSGREEGNGSDHPSGDVSASATRESIEEIKSIVLSLEWEINDRILEQLEDEINKLYLLQTDNRIVQGLLRILRFVGRYLRVRGVNSHQDSVNLLLSVFDHLENMMVSQWMTESEKSQCLIESIQQYRYWVERVDLETPEEMETPEIPLGEIKPLEMESPEYAKQQETPAETTSIPGMELSEDRFRKEQKPDELREEEPPAEELAEEEPSAETEAEQAITEEPMQPEPDLADTIALSAKEEEPPAEELAEEEPSAEPEAEQAITEEPMQPEPDLADTIALSAKEEEPPAEELAEEEPSAEPEAEQMITEEPLQQEPDQGDIVAPTVSEPEMPVEPMLPQEPEPEQIEKIEPAMEEREAFVETRPISMDEMPSERHEDVERTIAAIKDLPPHEAFAYALEELRKTFQSEIDALKEEIRLLKK